MGDEGPAKVPRPLPPDDEDAEARDKLLENNGVNAEKSVVDGMAGADRIEPENGKAV